MLPVDARGARRAAACAQPRPRDVGEARLPDGTVRPLITIRDWDFRWQDVYRYATPIALPKGSTISMRYTYDNSAANPRNPFHPPHRIVWGQNTTDEMGDFWVQLVPARNADVQPCSAPTSRGRRAPRTSPRTRACWRAIRATRCATTRSRCCICRTAARRRRSTHFRESLRLNDDSAPTHYNLGLALSMLRQYADAMREFEAAVRIDPDYAEAHNNLGAMLHVAGRLDEAASHYRRALELRPDNVEARANLGRLLMLQGKAVRGRRAVRAGACVQPDSVASLTGLAWIRATAADARFGGRARRFRWRSARVSSAAVRILRRSMRLPPRMQHWGSSTKRSRWYAPASRPPKPSGQAPLARRDARPPAAVRTTPDLRALAKRSARPRRIPISSHSSRVSLQVIHVPFVGRRLSRSVSSRRRCCVAVGRRPCAPSSQQPLRPVPSRSIATSRRSSSPTASPAIALVRPPRSACSRMTMRGDARG